MGNKYIVVVIVHVIHTVHQHLFPTLTGLCIEIRGEEVKPAQLP